MTETRQTFEHLKYCCINLNHVVKHWTPLFLPVWASRRGMFILSQGILSDMQDGTATCPGTAGRSSSQAQRTAPENYLWQSQQSLASNQMVREKHKRNGSCQSQETRAKTPNHWGELDPNWFNDGNSCKKCSKMKMDQHAALPQINIQSFLIDHKFSITLVLHLTKACLCS